MAFSMYVPFQTNSSQKLLEVFLLNTSAKRESHAHPFLDESLQRGLGLPNPIRIYHQNLPQTATGTASKFFLSQEEQNGKP